MRTPHLNYNFLFCNLLLLNFSPNFYFLSFPVIPIYCEISENLILSFSFLILLQHTYFFFKWQKLPFIELVLCHGPCTEVIVSQFYKVGCSLFITQPSPNPCSSLLGSAVLTLDFGQCQAWQRLSARCWAPIEFINIPY